MTALRVPERERPLAGPSAASLLPVLTLVAALLLPLPAAAQAPVASAADFVTVWEVSGGDLSLTIPTEGGGYDYTVDWGDGAHSTGHPGDASHTYDRAGEYTVRISGEFPRLWIGNRAPHRNRIRSVEQWGSQVWGAVQNGAFNGAANFTINAADRPDLSGVTHLNNMFANTADFNADIGHWDVSNVTSMRGMFSDAAAFNRSLNGWDVSRVENFRDMFWNARAFNGDISGWRPSAGASFQGMFFGAAAFDRDLGNWTVSAGRDFRSMFRNAARFDRDLGGWDVSNVTNMARMFRGAAGFDRDLGGWNVSSVTNMSGMFEAATLSTANYDALLIGWSARPVQSNVRFHGGRSRNSAAAQVARDRLTDVHNWSITDGGIDAGAPLKPTLISATPGDGKVALAWSPGGDGGSTITRWQYSSDDGSAWDDVCVTSTDAGCPATTFTVASGLANGQSYTFRVRAVNDFDGDDVDDPGEASNGISATPTAALALGAAVTVPEYTVGGTIAGLVFPEATGGTGDKTYTLTDRDGQEVDGTARSAVPGLSFDTRSRTLSGTPAAPGDYALIYRAVDSADPPASVRQHYTVAVSAITAANDDAKLSGITLSVGTSTLTPDFNPAVSDYMAYVGNSTMVVTVTPTTSDASASVTVNGQLVTADSPGVDVTLLEGSNNIIMLVRAENGSDTLEYSVEVNRFPISDNDFVFTWEVPAGPDNTFWLPVSGAIETFFMDFGDGRASMGVPSNGYATGGTYTVRVKGNLTRLNASSGSINSPTVRSIVRWGDSKWRDMREAFQDTDFDLTTPDVPDFSRVSSMLGMFRRARNFTGANSRIGDWDVSNVDDMDSMFADATAFNQDIGNWNVGKVTDMRTMFYGAAAFNHDIRNWNVAMVEFMQSMFSGTTAFDQNIGDWNIGNVRIMVGMFEGVTLSTVNYDSLLVGWESRPHQPRVAFSGGQSRYSDVGAAARERLILNRRWLIRDGGHAGAPAVSYTPPDTLQVGVAIARMIPVYDDHTIDLFGAWSATDLPPGLSINPDNGAIFGTPSVFNQDSVTATVRVRDALGHIGTPIIDFPPVDWGTQTLTGFAYSPSSGEPGASIALTAPTVNTPTGEGAGALSYTTNDDDICTVIANTGALTLVGAGTCRIRATAARTAGYEAATVTFEVTVTNNGAPTISYSLPATLTVGVPVTIPPATSADDIDIRPPGGYALHSGALPPGLVLDLGTGEITGMPGTANSARAAVTIRVTDSGGNSADVQLDFPAVGKGTQTLAGFEYDPATGEPGASVTLTPPTVSTPTDEGAGALSYTTGAAATVCTVEIDGALALVGEGNCVVTVTAAETADYEEAADTFEVTVTNTGAPTVSYSLPGTLTVGVAVDTIAPATSEDDVDIPSSGGYALQSGTLPPGLVLDVNTGEITGMPRTANSARAAVTIRVTDSGNNIADVQLDFPAVDRGTQTLGGFAYSPARGEPGASITLAEPAVNTPTGDDGGALSYATGDATICTVIAGTGALTLVGAGSCVVTATAAETADYDEAADTFEVTVTNNVAPTISYSLPTTLTVGVPVDTIAPATSADDIDIRPPGGYALHSGALPPGLVLDLGTGEITGMPTTANSARAAVTLRVTDSGGNSADVQLDFPAVGKGTQTLAGFEYDPATGEPGASLTLTPPTVSTPTDEGAGALSYTTGAAATVCTVETDGALALVGEGSCVVTVTAAETADYDEAADTFEVTVTNTGAPTISYSLPTTLTVGVPVGTIAPATSEDDVDIPSTGGYALQSGALPPGLVLNLDTGEITGMPTTANSARAAVTLRVTDSGGNSADVQLDFPAVGKGTQTLAGFEYDPATGEPGASVTLTPPTVSTPTDAGAGALSYATNDATICTVIAGTGALALVGAGSCVVTVTAAETADYEAAADTFEVTVTNTGAPTISYSLPTTLTVGVPVGTIAPATSEDDVDIPSSGGYALQSGTLPPGLALDLDTGEITGMPTSANSARAAVTLRVTDSGGNSADVQLDFPAVGKGTQTLAGFEYDPATGEPGASLTLTPPTVNTPTDAGAGALSYATGAAATVCTVETDGALALVGEGSCVVTVTAAETADYDEAADTFEVTVTNTGAPTVSYSLPTTLTVGVPVGAIAPATSEDDVDIPSTGGYALQSGTLPPGLALDLDTGEITGMPTSANSARAAVTLRVTDSGGNSADVQLDFPAVDKGTQTLAGFEYDPATGEPGASVTLIPPTVNTPTDAGAGALSYATTAAATVCTVETDGALALVGAGSCVVTVTAAETADYDEAADTFEVTVTNTGAPTVSYSLPTTLTVGVPVGAIAPATSEDDVDIPSTGGYALQSGTLPPGLALDLDTGEITGMPTSANSARAAVTLRVTDSGGNSADVQLDFPAVDKGTQTLAGFEYDPATGEPGASVTLIPPTVNTPTDAGAGALSYATTAAATVCTVGTDGALALVGAGSCVVTVTAAETADYDEAADTFEVTVTNTGAPTVSYSLPTTLTVGVPVGTIAPATSEDDVDIPSTGGYALQSGALPPGLVLDLDTGEITGMPTSANSARAAVTLRVTDTGTNSADVQLDFPAVGKGTQTLAGFEYDPATGEPGASVTLIPPTVSTPTDAGAGALSYATTAAATVCTVGTDGALALVGAGSCVVTVTAAETADYEAAADTFEVTVTNTGAPTISYSLPTTLTVGVPVGAIAPATSEDDVDIPSSGGYALQSGTLPPGLVLDLDTGEITGMPTSANSARAAVTLRVTDSGGNSADVQLDFPAVGKGTQTLAGFEYDPATGEPGASVTLTPPTVNTPTDAGAGALSYATGAAATVCTVETDGALALVGEGSCVVTVTAAETADYDEAADTFEVTVTNTGAPTISYSLPTTLTVGVPVGTIAPATSEDDVDIPSSGGYALQSGALPPGLVLDLDTGEITGMPTSANSARAAVTLRVTDSGGNSADVQLDFPAVGRGTQTLAGFEYDPATGEPGASVTLIPPTVSTPTDAGAGALSYATNAAATVCTVETDGALALVGAGSCVVTVTAAETADYEAAADTFEVTVTNTGAPTISYSLPTTLTVGVPVGAIAPATSEDDVDIPSSGGYALQSGALPPGLALDLDTGEITGMPTSANSARAAVTLRVTDTGTNSADVQLDFPAVGKGTQTLAGFEYDPATGEPGASVTLIPPTVSTPTDAGAGALSYATTAAATVCTVGTDGALALVGAGSCVVTVTAAETADYEAAADTFEVTVTNTGAPTISYSLPTTLTVGVPVGAIAPATSEDDVDIPSSGGYALQSGALPPGLVLDLDTGEITGMPTSANSARAAVTLRVTDTGTNSADVQLDFPAVGKGTQTLAGFEYDPATGEPGASVTLIPPTVSTPTDAGAGALSYATTAAATVCTVGTDGALALVGAGSCVVTVTAAETADYEAAADTFEVTVTNTGAPTISYSLPTTLTVGVPVGAIAPATSEDDVDIPSSGGYALQSGALPPGLVLDLDTGEITGMPTSANSARAAVTLRVTDSGGNSADVQLDFPAVGRGTQTLAGFEYDPATGEPGASVTLIPPTVSTPTDAGAGALSYATNAAATVCTVETDGALALVGAGSCVVTVTAAETADYEAAADTFEVTVTNTGAPTISYSLPTTLTVGVPVGAIAPATSEDDVDIPSSGGYALQSGTLPPGLALDLDTGQITGTPTTANTATAAVTIRVTDTAGNSADESLTFPKVDKGTQTLTGFVYDRTSGMPGDRPTLTQPSQSTPTGDPVGALSYSTEAEAAVCTVAANTGALLLVGAGACEVKVTAAETANYEGTSLTFEVTVTNTGAPTVTWTLPGSLTVGVGITAIAPDTSDDDIDILDTGGYALQSGTLPQGLALDLDTGQITGTPTTANTATAAVTIRVTDTAGNTADVQLEFPAVDKGTQSLSAFAYTPASGEPGASVALTQTPVPTHEAAQATVSYATDAGAAVCTVIANTGALTLVDEGTCTVTATAAETDNYEGTSLTFDVMVTNEDAPSVSYTPPGTLKVGVGIEAMNPSTTDTDIPDSGAWSATGLPNGLDIDGDTGAITGTPSRYNASGVTATVTVRDTAGNAAMPTIAFPKVDKGAQSLSAFAYTPASGEPGASVALTQTPVPTHEAAQATVSYATDAGAAVCTVIANTGALTLVDEGTCTVTATAAETDNYEGTSLTFDVMVTNEDAPSVSYTPPGTLKVGVGIEAMNPSTTDTDIPDSGAWSATGLPNGLDIDGDTGAITGTPSRYNASGVTATVTVRDTAGNAAMPTIAFPKVDKGAQSLSAFAYTPATGEPGASVALTQTPVPTHEAAQATVSYATDADAVCTVIANTGALTLVDEGTCTVTATAAETDNYEGTSLTFDVMVTNEDAPSVSYTPPGTLKVGVGIEAMNPSTTDTDIPDSGAWSATGLPNGLDIDGDTGAITGTPSRYNASGVTATVTVRDTAGNAAMPTIAFPKVDKGAQSLSAFAYTPATGEPGASVALTQTPVPTHEAAQATVSYATDADAVCTVIANTGALTLVDEGTCTVTATAAETDNYEGTSLTFKVTVTNTGAPTVTWTLPGALTVGVGIAAIAPNISDDDIDILATDGYALQSGTLPQGLALDLDTGEITGTPTTANTATAAVTIRVTDTGTNSADVQLEFPAVNKGTQTLTGFVYDRTSGMPGDRPTLTQPSQSTPTGDPVGTLSYSTNADTVCTVVDDTGALLLVGDGACTITVTAAATANYEEATDTFEVTVTNTGAPTVTWTLPGTLTVGVGITAIAPDTSDDDIDILASDGYALHSGTLPQGLVLDLDSGEIAGTPTTANTATAAVTIRVTDTGTNIADVQLEFPAVDKGAQTLTGFAYGQTSGEPGDRPTLTQPSQGTPTGDPVGALSYSTNADTVCTVDANTGALLLVGDGTCTITVTAAATANYEEATDTFEVTVTNTGAPTVTWTLPGTLTVGVGITIAPDTSDDDVDIPSSGGYALQSGALPPGLVLDLDSGEITGTPTTANTATAAVTLRVTDTGTNSADVQLELPAVDKGTQTLTGFAYGRTSGMPGDRPTLTEPSQSTPTGDPVGALSYSTNADTVCTVADDTGALLLVGDGTCTITVTAAETANYEEATDTFAVTVGGDSTAPSVRYSPPTTLTVGVGIAAMSPATTDTDIPASGAWSATGLPNGLKIDGDSGVITGTPSRYNASGVTATVTVRDAAGNEGEPTIAFPAVDRGDQDLSAFAYLPARVEVNGTTPQLTEPVLKDSATAVYSTASTGVCTVVANTGALTIQGEGACTVTATVAQTANYNEAARNTEVTVGVDTTAPRVTYSPPTTLTVGVGIEAMSPSTTDTDIPAAGAWSATGLPNGLNIDVDTGAITGTPTQHTASGVTATVTVQDETGNEAQPTIAFPAVDRGDQDLSAFAYLPARVEVNGTTPQLTEPVLKDSATAVYSTASTGVCTVGANTGALTIQGEGVCTVTATVAQTANYNEAARNTEVTVGVDTTAPRVTYSPPTTLTVGVGIEAMSPSTTDTDIPDSGAWSATGLPNGLNIDVDTGAITGTPTQHTASGVTATVTVQDETGHQAQPTIAFPAVDRGDQDLSAFAYLPARVEVNGTTPQLTEPVLKDSATAVYSTASTGVCTVVANTGALTIQGEGVCTVTATVAQTANYEGTSLTFDVIVTNEDAPSVSYTPPGTLTVGVGIEAMSPATTDPDIPAAGAWSATGLPNGLNIDVDTGAITGTPSRYNASGVTATVTVRDTAGNAAMPTIAFSKVDKGAQSLSAFSYTPATGGPGASVALTETPVPTHEAAQATVSYATSADAVCTVIANSGALLLVDEGTCTVTATAAETDNYEGTSLTFDVMVTNEDAPSVSYTPPGTLTVGVRIEAMSPAYADTDIPATGAWSAAGLPDGLDIDANSGAITGTPTKHNASGVAATVTVRDAAGNEATPTIAFPKVDKGTQTLTGFVYSPASGEPGDTPTLTEPMVSTPTKEAGGALSYATDAGDTICTVIADTGALILVGAGACEVTATAAGTDNYNEARDTFKVTVNPDTTAPSVSYEPPDTLKVGVGIEAMSPDTDDTDIPDSGAWSAEGLPDGLKINVDTGAITGTPTRHTASSVTATVTVSDAAGNEAQPTIAFPAVDRGDRDLSAFAYLPASVEVNGATPQLREPVLKDGATATYSTTSAEVCTVVADTGALTIEGEGACTVTATVAQTANYNEAIRTAQVTVGADTTAPSVRYSSPGYSPPDTLKVGVDIEAINPDTDDTDIPDSGAWSAEGLPDGLKINVDTGAITGTPTQHNASGVTATVTVQDETGNQVQPTIAFPAVDRGDRDLSAFAYLPDSVEVNGVTPQLTEPVLLDSATAVYSTAGTGVCTVVADTGALTIQGEGACEVTAAVAQTANYNGATRNAQVTVGGDTTAPSVTYTPPNKLTVGVLMPTLTPVASDIDIASWEAPNNDLPAGLAIDRDSGAITGTPTRYTASGVTVIIRATDTADNEGETPIAFPAVDKGAQTLTGFGYSLTSGEPGASVTLAAPTDEDGGALSYATDAAAAVCTVIADTGALTLVGAGACEVTATAAATDNYKETRVTFAVTVTNINAPVIRYTAPDKLTVGVTMDALTPVTDDIDIASWEAPNDDLPAGLAIDRDSGAITGTPTRHNASGVTVTIRATDTAGNEGATPIAFPAVDKGAQTLTGFGYAPASGLPGDRPTLTPPAVSTPTKEAGGSLNYATAAAAGTVCTVETDGALLLVDAGACAVTVTAAETANYLPATDTFEVTVTAVPVLRVAADSTDPFVEGSAPAISFTVTVSLAPASDIQVSYRIEQEGAFTSDVGVGTLTLPAGETTATRSVPVTDDNTAEADGSITFVLQADGGYTVASPPNNAATRMVQDDDTPTATAPLMPTLDSAMAGDRQVTLSWTSGGDGGSPITKWQYTITDGTTWEDICETSTTIGCPTITSHTVNRLTNGAEYTFQVRAVNIVGEGAESGEQNATPAAVPDAPTGVAATPGDGRLTVSWTEPANDGGAVITGYAATAAGGGSSQTCMADGATTRCAIEGLINGQTYSVTVTATNGVGESAPSAAVMGTPAVGGLDTLHDVVAPELARAMTASTLKVVSDRIHLAGSGGQAAGPSATDSLSHLLPETLSSLVVNSEQDSRTRKRFLVERSVAYLTGMASGALSADGGGGSGGQGGGLGGLSAWGATDYRNLSGEAQSVDWNGDLFAIHLGVDRLLRPNLLAGLSASWFDAEFDYARPRAGGPQSGVYGSEMISAHPYLGWLGEGRSLWTSVGYGAGSIEVDEELAAESSDSALQTVAFGGHRQLSYLGGGSTRLNLKGEAWLTRFEIDGGGRLIEELSVAAQRVRLGLELAHERELGGGRMEPWVEGSLRYDGGDGETGGGFALASGLRYNRSRLSLGVDGSVLLGHGGNVDEWTVSGLLGLEPAANGGGLSFSLRSNWGMSVVTPDQLWQGDAIRSLLPQAEGAPVGPMRFNAKLGYDLPLRWNHVLFTPGAGLDLTSGGERLRLGAEFDFDLGFLLSFEAFHDRRASAESDTGVQLRITSRGRRPTASTGVARPGREGGMPSTRTGGPRSRDGQRPAPDLNDSL